VYYDAQLEQLASPPKCDYLMIAAAGFKNGLSPLITHRRAQGLDVLALDVSEVLDGFGYGYRNGDAIKRFTQYLSQFQSAFPQYLLLAGDCSDYRGDPRRLPKVAQPDLVPTIGPIVGEGMHGDQGYALLAGEDSLADISVGRLPVQSASALSEVIHKIIDYENAPVDGNWAARGLYAFDDNQEFEQVVRAVLADTYAPPIMPELLRQADYEYVPNIKVPGRKRSHGATERLIKYFNDGCGLINFFGHGGPNLWSHERMLLLSDLDLISNAPKLPLLTCLSCDNAWMIIQCRL